MKNTPLSEKHYHELLDTLMLTIEDAIDETGLDIDYQTAAGILTLVFDNRSQIILSRQTALLQLWMAARSGGFHFNYDEEKALWLQEGSSETFAAVLNRCLSDQSGKDVQLRI